MSCSCHLTAPCHYCENMPEEAVDIQSELNSLNHRKDELTSRLKEMDSSSPSYSSLWNQRVDIIGKINEKESRLEEIYPS